MSSNTMPLAAVREREFPIVRDYTYLNTASQGPWPNRTLQAVQQQTAVMQYVNTDRARAVPSPEADARARLARLINARPEEIVFTGSTTPASTFAHKGLIGARATTSSCRATIFRRCRTPGFICANAGSRCASRRGRARGRR